MEIGIELMQKTLHDLKNPASIIEMYTSLLKEELMENDKLKGYEKECNVIEDSAKLILETLTIINKIINLEKGKDNALVKIKLEKLMNNVKIEFLKKYTNELGNEIFIMGKNNLLEVLNIVFECLFEKIGIESIIFNIKEKDNEIIFEIIFEDLQELIKLDVIFNEINKEITYLKKRATGLEFLYLKKIVEMSEGKIKTKILKGGEKKIEFYFKKRRENG